MIKQVILEKRDQYGFLIMAHRGFWGGNIIENTVESADLAFRAGADIVELDVCRTLDGRYYLFHDGNEPKLLGRPENFKELTSAQIDASDVYNSIGSPSGYAINTLQHFLEWLPENRLVNLDRSWDYWGDSEFFDVLAASGKTDQLVLKSPARKELLDAFSANGRGLAYVPIVKERSETDSVLAYEQIQTIGLELIISSSESDLLDENWLQELRRNNVLTIVNSEKLGKDFNLFNHLDDDTALFSGTKWDAFVQAGADIIQTDWPNFLCDYREKIKKRW